MNNSTTKQDLSLINIHGLNIIAINFFYQNIYIYIYMYINIKLGRSWLTVQNIFHIEKINSYAGRDRSISLSMYISIYCPTYIYIIIFIKVGHIFLRSDFIGTTSLPAEFVVRNL